MDNSGSVIVSRWPAPFIETTVEQSSRFALYYVRLHVRNQSSQFLLAVSTPDIVFGTRGFPGDWPRDSVVGIATRYGLNGPGIRSRWGKIFRNRPNWPLRAPSLLCSGYRVLFLGVKRPGRGAYHPPSTSAEVRGRVELYLFSSCGPSWPVVGWTLPFTFTRRLVIVTEVSRDFIQLLQAFHRLGMNIIFYRSVIKCYVDSICSSHFTAGDGAFAFVSMYESGLPHSRYNQSGGWRKIPFATRNRKLAFQHVAEVTERTKHVMHCH